MQQLAWPLKSVVPPGSLIATCCSSPGRLLTPTHMASTGHPREANSVHLSPLTAPPSLVLVQVAPAVQNIVLCWPVVAVGYLPGSLQRDLAF